MALSTPLTAGQAKLINEAHSTEELIGLLKKHGAQLTIAEARESIQEPLHREVLQDFLKRTPSLFGHVREPLPHRGGHVSQGSRRHSIASR